VTHLIGDNLNFFIAVFINHLKIIHVNVANTSGLWLGQTNTQIEKWELW